MMAASLNIHNLCLVAPLAVVALCLCLVILPQCFRRAGEFEAEPSGPQAHGASALGSMNLRKLAPIGGLVAALGLYVSFLDVIGFDVATWLFVLATMLICGERRWLPLALYPLLVSLVLIGAVSGAAALPDVHAGGHIEGGMLDVAAFLGSPLHIIVASAQSWLWISNT